MFHLFPWPNFLPTINFYILVIGFLRRRRQRTQINESWHDFFQILTFSIPLLMDWIQLILLYRRLLSLRIKSKYRLIKPHMLLRILAGYRANVQNKDLWTMLENNWNHFFWLTGETPVTLLNLVNTVQRTFYPNTDRGRKKVLNFQNQV